MSKGERHKNRVLYPSEKLILFTVDNKNVIILTLNVLEYDILL